ncbi:MAG: hypothetical protein ACI35O_04055 [Bacillaceae bacterium]
MAEGNEIVFLLVKKGKKMAKSIKRLGKVTGNIDVINKRKETLSNGTKVYYATIKRNKQGGYHMPHKHIQSRIKVPSPPVQIKVKVPVKLTIGIFSCYKLIDVYEACYKLGIKVVSCTSLGGVINKKYVMEIEGYKRDLTVLQRVLGRG